MLDVRKASWKHISQLTVCRDAQGVHLSRSPAEQPLKACFRGYSFSPMHCEKQKFAKYCNVNRAQSVLLSHMSTEEVAHQCRSKQDSASHLPMPRSMALRFAGHSHCCRAAFGPAASKTLLVDTWDAGRHYSLDQAWFLSPRQRDCLKLGHETWLKVSVSLMNPKILLWLQNHWHFGPLCHRNFWAPSLQPSLYSRRQRALWIWFHGVYCPFQPPCSAQPTVGYQLSKPAAQNTQILAKLGIFQGLPYHIINTNKAISLHCFTSSTREEENIKKGKELIKGHMLKNNVSPFYYTLLTWSFKSLGFKRQWPTSIKIVQFGIDFEKLSSTTPCWDWIALLI